MGVPFFHEKSLLSAVSEVCANVNGLPTGLGVSGVSLLISSAFAGTGFGVNEKLEDGALESLADSTAFAGFGVNENPPVEALVSLADSTFFAGLGVNENPPVEALVSLADSTVFTGAGFGVNEKVDDVVAFADPLESTLSETGFGTNENPEADDELRGAAGCPKEKGFGAGAGAAAGAGAGDCTGDETDCFAKTGFCLSASLSAFVLLESSFCLVSLYDSKTGHKSISGSVCNFCCTMDSKEWLRPRMDSKY